MQPLAAEDKAAYTILANENADAAAMLKQAEKANAAWRNRAAKILQRVDSAEEKGPSGKRQKIAKATRLVDADDRPGARRLPAGSAALPASAGEADRPVASTSTGTTPPPKPPEDVTPKHVEQDEVVAIPNLARLSARRAPADKVQVTPPQAETTETTANAKAGESATLQPEALPAQTETAPLAGTAAAGAPPRVMGQRLNEESMGERMRQQGAPTFAESAKGISNMANQAKGDAAAEEDKKAKAAAAVPKFTLGDIMPAKSTAHAGRHPPPPSLLSQLRSLQPPQSRRPPPRPPQQRRQPPRL